jgi:hypothetical protein
LRVKIKAPNAADLVQMFSAIQSFPRAWGSIDATGEYRGMAADPRIAWAMINSNAEQQSTMWRIAGISMEPTSSFADMQAATEHIVYLHLFKFKKGLFGSVWAANIVLMFDKKQIMLGAIGAADQTALWDRLRALQAGRGETLANVFEAAASV